MSKSSDAANAVVNAIEQVCSLYAVDCFRMQSRVIMMEGTAGRMRPMYFGKWRDRFGEVHSSGMADVLARPQIPVMTPWTMTIHDSKNPDSLVDIMEHGAGSPNSMRIVLPSVSRETASAIIARQREQARRTVTVPLWIEGKSGSGRLTPKQRLFKSHVEWNGESYIELSNDVRPLIAWFDAHGVKKCEHCGGKRWMHKIGETPIHCPKCDPRK